MNPILEALKAGKDPYKILEFIKKFNPNLATQITAAQMAGKGIEKILSYLAQFGGNLKGDLKSYKGPVGNEFKQSTYGVAPEIPAMAKTGLAVAALAGGYALSRGLTRAAGAIRPSEILPAQQEIASAPRGLPNQAIKKSLPFIQEEPVATQEVPTEPTPQMPIEAPKVIDLPLRIKDRVDAMLASNNPPDIIAGTIRKVIPKDVKEFEKAGVSLDQAIVDYISQVPKQAEQKIKPRQMQAAAPESAEISQEPQIATRLVSLPGNQIGEVQEIKDNIARIVIDGKEKRFNVDDLIESPKEAAEVALELIKSFTPEQERSAHHALSMYDEDTNSAYFLFHDGSGYRVDDITPEEYERLSTEVDAARTSGKTKIGAWATGAGSRGAAYQSIVKDLKKPFKKIKVGYNLFKSFQQMIKNEQKRKKN
jgi:hypothetical protein